ncbi:MAG: PLxRFG domain-containing protein [Telluria sp.]
MPVTTNPYDQFVEPPEDPAKQPKPGQNAEPVNPYAQFVSDEAAAGSGNGGGLLRDTGIDVVQGLADIGRQAYGVANVVTGGKLDRASRSIAGLADRAATEAGNALTGQNVQPTGAQALPTVAQGFERVDRSLEGLHTEQRQQLERERARAMDEADGPLDEAWAGLSYTLANPSLLAGDLTRSAASMVAPGAAAGAVARRFGPGAAKAAAERALAAGATREAAVAAGREAASKLGERTVIGITGMGQVGGGANVDAINRTHELAPEVLAANPKYQALLAQGMDPLQARDEMARGAGLVSFALAAPLSIAASKLTGAGRQFSDMATGNYAGRGIADFARAALREAGQETIESGGEALAGNIGQQHYGDVATPTWKGVAGAAAVGGLAGLVMGGGEHIVGRMTAPQQAQPVQPPAVAPTPAGQGAAAVPVEVAGARAAFDSLMDGPAVPAAAPAALALPPDAGPLTRAAAIATGGLADMAGAPSRPVFPFTSAELAQKQADELARVSGFQYQVGPHPSVPGRFAALPVMTAPAAATQQAAEAPSTPGQLPQVLSNIDAAAHEAASSPLNERTPPSGAQALAGNYKKGQGTVAGLSISFENAAGSVREDKNNQPPRWQTLMQDHYGYFKGVPARAPDKDRVDVFVKNNTPDDWNGNAYVVDQNDEAGNFDEPKVILGADSAEDARATYLRNYDAGFENRIGAITELPLEGLRARLNDESAFQQPQQPLIARAEAQNGLADAQDGPAAAAPERSAQYGNYAQAIEAGEITPGLLEQINVDARLDDGEAQQLAALARSKMAQFPPGAYKPRDTVQHDGREWQVEAVAHTGREMTIVTRDQGKFLRRQVAIAESGQPQGQPGATSPAAGAAPAAALDGWDEQLDPTLLDGTPEGVARENARLAEALQRWGYRADEQFPTHGNGLVSPKFKDIRTVPLLPPQRPDSRPQASVEVARGPNGKWAYGFELMRDDHTYATATRTYRHEAVRPDGRPQFDSERAALAAGIAHVKRLANPEMAARIGSGPGPATSAADALQARVLQALAPGQFGGRLTAQRVGAILGADQPGISIGTEKAQALLDALEAQGKVAKQGSSYVLAPAGTTAPATPAATGVHYPNRKLGFEQAASGPDQEYHEHAWANIAAANMAVGDTFELNRKQVTVQAITAKTLKLKDADGKVRTLNPDGVAWEQFKRDLGSQLAVENLQANNPLTPARPLIEILKRDPAVQVDERGSVHLVDRAPDVAPAATAAGAQQDDDVRSRAAHAYAEVLAQVPDLPHNQLLREQLGEQVRNPSRYAQLDEADNPAGLRVGDRVTTGQDEDLVAVVTSIVKEGNGKLRAHLNSPHSYGGWHALDSLVKTDAPLQGQAVPTAETLGQLAAEHVARAERRGTKGISTTDPTPFRPGQVEQSDQALRAALKAAGWTRKSGKDERWEKGGQSVRLARALEKQPLQAIFTGTQTLAAPAPQAAGAPAQAPQQGQQQDGDADATPIPDGIAALFDGGVSKPAELRRLRALLGWGYDASNMVFNMFGRPADTLAGGRAALSAGSDKHLKLTVYVAQAPNGKWGMGVASEAPGTGSTQGASVFSEQYDSRLAAVTAGVERVIADMPQWKAKSGANATSAHYQNVDEAYLDKLVAELKAQLGVLRGKEKAGKDPDAPKAWQGTEFAQRIAALLEQLRAGAPDMVTAFESGLEMDAKQGKLSEETVAFREDKARQIIAGNARAGKPVEAVKIGLMTPEKLAEISNVVPALPKPIVAAAVAKWNELAPKLAALGFKFGEVNTGHPDNVREAHRALQEIAQALDALAARRYFAIKNPKQAKPESLARAEKHASDTLGIDTLAHPGVDTTRQITLGVGVKQPANGAPKGEVPDTATPVVSAGDGRTAQIDAARLVFVGASTYKVSETLMAKVQEALRTRPDSYTVGRYHKDDTRISLPPPKKGQRINMQGGELIVRDNGHAYLIGDDTHGWASTMSQQSVTRTLTEWLANMGEAPAAKPKEQDKPGLAKMQQAKAEKEAAKAPDYPMTREAFVAALRRDGKVQFGEAKFELAEGKLPSTYVVHASYPSYNTTIGDPRGHVSAEPMMSMSEAVERAANAAFEWWKDKRGPEQAFAARRARLVRAGQREIYNVASRLPALMDAAALPHEQFLAKAETAINAWVAAERGRAEGDADRTLMLDNMVVGGKSTLPKEFFASLQKYLQRAKRAADLLAARDPEVYKAALSGATTKAGVPAEQDQVALFMDGWDHALAGRTKSTLRAGELPARGYEAALAWRNTDTGRAWYTGKRGKKLESTGAELRRWFDEATRRVKQLDAANLPASYALIKEQASRVSAFAGVAAEGATPGTLRYITDLRDQLRPFQQWLLEQGPLRHLRNAGWRESESTQVAMFLDGQGYLTENEWAKHGIDGAGPDFSTPGQRLALLQAGAAEYMEGLRRLAEVLAGSRSVAEAAAKFDAAVYKKEKDSESRRVTALGEELSGLFKRGGGRYYRFIPDGYDTRQHQAHEHEPDGPADKKAPLLVPKLDRVVREGEAGKPLPDYRRGKNVTPQQMKETFGFADVGFGNYVAAGQDQDHLNYAYDAFMDLATFLSIEPKHIGLNGTLYFTIGKLGHGRHAAHFQARQQHPDGRLVPVINVTNTKGDGTVAHEWAHALDHALSGGVARVDQHGKQTWRQHLAVARVVRMLTTSEPKPDGLMDQMRRYADGTSFWISRGSRSQKPLYNLDSEEGLAQNVREALRQYTGTRGQGTTSFKRQADEMGAAYWGNDRELFARAFEAHVLDNLGGISNYLVNPEWVAEGKIKAPQYKGAPYPEQDERKLFSQGLAALIKALRFSDDDALAVDMDAFQAAFPDGTAALKEAKQAVLDRLPELVKDGLASRRAARLARKQEQEARERAKQELANAERIARDAAAQAARDEAARKEREAREAAEQARLQALEAAQQDPLPPSGPLSDQQLEDLFDQAAVELAAEQQEQPQAPAPGEALEPAAGAKLSREDVEFLLKSYDAGTVFLLADPAFGLPTIHDLSSRAVHKGFGVFELATPEYTVQFEAGGAMRSSPGGHSYTSVNVKDGRGAFLQAIGWDGVRAKLQARLIVKSGPKAAPALTDEQDKTAAKLIAEAAKLGVSGIDEALKGLTKLFGGGPGKLQSFPGGMDEDTYQQAKPHFEAALKKFQAMGKTLVDLFKLLIHNFGNGVKPYAIRFAKEQGLTENLGAPASGTTQVAEWVRARLDAQAPFTSKELFEQADAAFGGSQAAGSYSVKDAYDAMEAGVNRYVLAARMVPHGSAAEAAATVARLERVLGQLPTQTRRTSEMDDMQQFSTPPQLAFAAAWAANIRAGETLLEPSAGVGGIAMYGQLAGARLVVNELSSRRAAVLAEVLPQAQLFSEDAEQLNNVLPEEVAPSVIVMNPPFSAAADRLAGVRDTKIGAAHIEQALKRLEEGGRLVAIVGAGMGDDRPAFKAWWDQIKQDYNVRANIGVDGKNYAKYGTTFDNQLLVIDKTGPTRGEVLTGQVATVGELPAILEAIRNDRQGTSRAGEAGQPAAAEQGGGALAGGAAAANGTVGTDADALGAGERGQAAAAGAGAPGRGPDDGADQRDDQVGTTAGDEVPDQPGDGRGHGAVSARAGASGGRGRSGGRAAGKPVQRNGGQQPVTDGRPGPAIKVEQAEQQASTAALTDAIFEDYSPQRLKIAGAKPHPGKLVQSAAMNAVLPPAPTYTPHLPKKVIEQGLLSLAQLEAVVYAGQAHAEMLKGDKERRGFFIGDGTGVGKGREIAGILLDNWNQGRKKAVWLSAKQGLLRDAQRDFSGIGGDSALLLAHTKVKADGKIDAKQGILFTTYDTLRSGFQQQAPSADMDAKQIAATYPPGTKVEVGPGRVPYSVAKWDVKNQRVFVRDEYTSSRAVPLARLHSVGGHQNWSSIAHLKAAKPKDAGASRLDQIVEWLGADFDGVIAFDEAHNMGNVFPKKGKRGTSKPAAKALAGVELQRRLPNARIVYVSATGATEVSNLGYATRLGLWGEGTAFAQPSNFIGAIEGGGVAAMELVSRDMKAAGAYLARSLSFDGVTYDRLEHQLTELQVDIYNELARAWQMVLANINAALEATKQDKVAKAKSAALAQFWGSHQRFFNHIITAMQTPAIIEAAQRDLEAGHAVVLQLVNTNEAEQERQAAKIAGDDDAVLEDFDFTPRETLLNYVRHGFPVTQYETFTDSEGNPGVRAVLDSAGKPVENRDMVKLREQLVKTLEQIRVPDNPMDMVINAFGPDNVAEITGRKRRFVQVQGKDGAFKVIEQKRPASAVTADADAFMADRKRVLVFSDAGGTGYSFQSDLNVKNQRRRIHYLVQPGWRANNAVQGFGRTHRSNEANQPHYVLPTTNLKAHKRFISSIARRLDQLGALTKGQRETGGQGMFAATDNLESQYAHDALRNLFLDMYNRTATLDFQETTDALGLNGLIDPNTGALVQSKLPEVPQFLNRLLSLTTDMQDKVFDEFFRRLEETIARAKAQGTFDAGMETLRADKAEKVREETVYQDPRTGAATRYIELELTHPVEFNDFDEVLEISQSYGEGFLGFYRNEKNERVFSLVRTGTTTKKDGSLATRGRRMMVAGGARYGDDVDAVLAGAAGNAKVKKQVLLQKYTRPAEPIVEKYRDEQGEERQLTDTNFGRAIETFGLAHARAQVNRIKPGPQREAAIRLFERMEAHLDKGAMQEALVPAYTRLSEDEARAAWEAEQAAMPATYTSRTHLLTGMLLPIWDRLPGQPRVVRVQTTDGERLLGRVLAESDLRDTLRNLGVGSNLDQLAPAQVHGRILAGERAILANGWIIKAVRVSNDKRIELSGRSMYSGERQLLVQQGAFVERINWEERVFIPASDAGVEVLARILSSKPLVELGKEANGDSDGDDAMFSRASPARGMEAAAVQRQADALAAGWRNAPRISAVQSVAELPFKAPSDTRGAYYQGRVWLVAGNLAHEGEVQFVLAHEALGHLGLAAIMPPAELAAELNRLRMINPALAAAARAQREKYGYELVVATEEALADMAGAGKPIRGWQKFVAKVQAALRALGLDRVADWIERHTQAETMDLLRRAREAIEGRRAPRLFGQAEAARFSDGAAQLWYSELARQLEKMPMKAAPAKQWAGTLDGLKAKGVKAEEIEWSGVLEWLGMQQGKVTKEALLDYLAGNGVRVAEVLHQREESVQTPESRAEWINEQVEKARRDYAESVVDWQLERALEHYPGSGHYIAPADPADDGGGWNLYREDHGLVSEHASELEADEALVEAQMDAQMQYEDDVSASLWAGFSEDTARSLAAEDFEEQFAREDTTEYGKYTLDGGREYKELLLTLPNLPVKAATTAPEGATVSGKVRFANQAQAAAFLESISEEGLDVGAAGNGVVEYNLSLPDYDIFIDQARSSGATVTAEQARYTDGLLFQSKHWAEQNVLAHIRFNEREGANGERVLFVEELQSDWQQQGRRLGFKDQFPNEVLDAALKYGMSEQQARADINDIMAQPFTTEQEDRSGQWQRLLAATEGTGIDLNEVFHDRPVLGVTRAPFVTSTSGWLQLAIKRLITYAAHNGFDRVAFINGDQSAERYQLGKHVDRVAIAMKGYDSAWLVTGWKDGSSVISREAASDRELAELVGKELAEKAIKEGGGEYAGLDLKVGGNGMRAFYDKIVPKAVNEVLKKLGGGAVTRLRLVNPAEAAAFNELNRGQAGPAGDADLAYPAFNGFAITDDLRAKAAGGLPLFARVEEGGASYEGGSARQKAKPGADVRRLTSLLGPQLYGNMSEMGPVTVKELFQNSFDALKGALEAGQIEQGRISIRTDFDARTITLTDNGTGMTPEVINKAFLTIAGTSKETERSSGGFGIAKMLFLFGNEKLSLVTVRNGVEARLDTTGEQLMASFDNPEAAPEIETRRVDAPSGTTVTVTVPRTFRNPSSGEDERINFPDSYSLRRTLAGSPLFENIVVDFNGDIQPVGANFDKDAYTTFSTVDFDWGRARIIVSKKEGKLDRYGPNVMVLSNGLYQFGQTLKDNPFEYSSEEVPRMFFINLEPRVKPEEPGYPFALNRQGFSPAVAGDFDKIMRYLAVLYGANKAASNAAGFGQVEYINPDNSVSDKLQLAPKLDDEARRSMLHINEGDKIEVRDGRMTVNGREVPALTREDMDKVKIDFSKFKIAQDSVDATRPMVHDNLDLVFKGSAEQVAQIERLRQERDQARRQRDALYEQYAAARDANDEVPIRDTEAYALASQRKEAAREAWHMAGSRADEADEALDAMEAQVDALPPRKVPITTHMRKEFGQRFDAYLGEMGRLFMALRDAVAAEDASHYGRLVELPVGTSFDKEYYGVHTMTPFRAMYLNPALSQLDAPLGSGEAHSSKRVASAMMSTMIHEIAHFRQMNHSTAFISEMQRLMAMLESSDKFNHANLRSDLRSILDRHHDIYSALNSAVRGNVENRGVVLADAGSWAGRHAGPPDQLAAAGAPEEHGGRVAGQAGAGAGTGAAGKNGGAAGGQAGGGRAVAGWTGERIEHLLSAYAYTGNGARSKAYAAWISPADYLALTTERIERVAAEARPLDAAELAAQRQEIYLQVDDLHRGARLVTGHEGRHRAYALMQAGVTAFPVVVYSGTGAQLAPQAELRLDGQDFGFARAPGRAIALRDATPISYDNAALLAERFGRVSGDGPKFSRAGVTGTPEFKRWFGNSKVVDEQGRPLVVYHGARPGTDIEAFKVWSHEGAYFTPDPGYAAAFTEDLFDEHGGTPGAMYPAYLSIQKPYMVVAEDQSDEWLQFIDRGLDREELIARGYDGAILRHKPTGEIDQVIAFHPEQVKSVTGNAGTFDPANTDIRFSRAGETIRQVAESLRSGQALRQLTDSAKSALSSHQSFNNFNWYDKTISTQYNKARKDADFRAVFEPALQQVDDTAHYAIEAEQLAPDVLIRMDGAGEVWQALVKGGTEYKADMAVVAQALFANIEGVQGVHQYVYNDFELRRDFNMTDRQIALYRQARMAVDASIARLAQTTIMAMARSEGLDVRAMKDMTLDDTVAMVKDALRERRAMAFFRARMVALAEGREPPQAPVDDGNDKVMQAIDGIVETATHLQQAGYMPAMRFGHYAITVRDPQAEPGEPPRYFATFETELAAHTAYRRLVGEFPGMEVTRSVMNDEQYQMFKGVSPETVELFARFSGMDQTEAYHDYIALARANRYARKHEIERQGVAGFSEDAPRVLASFLLSNARQSAINVNASDVAEALASKQLARKGDVQREAQRLVQYLNNPNEEARMVRSAMFMYFIGGSVGSALVNLTQPVLQTLPWLTEHVGAVRAGAILLAAGRLALSRDGDKLPEHLKRAFARANGEGLTRPKEIHSLMADADASVVGSNFRLRALTQAWGGFFGHAEAFNRRTTFLAAYQAALDMGPEALHAKGFADEYDFARRALHETQGLYSKVSRPNWGRGPVGSVLFTFKLFSITYMEMLMRMPWKQKAIALALLTIGAGLEGWPFAENIEDLIDTLGQSMGYNTNSKRALRHASAELVGEDLAELLLHGAGRMSGADVAGRIGLGRILPGTAMFKPADAQRDTTTEMYGPVGSLAKAVYQSIGKAQEGRWLGPQGALMTLMPTAIKNAGAGVDMVASGEYRDRQGRPVMDVSVYEGALKFFGLHPARVAKQSAVVGDLVQDGAMMSKVRTGLLNQWARAVVDGDAVAARAMFAKMHEWNRNNPDYRVFVTAGALRERVLQLRNDRATRTVHRVPPGLRRTAIADLE